MSAIRLNQDGVMLRPTRSDECVRRRAAEIALPCLRGWRSLEGSDADLISELMKHIGASDGFVIAKSLEDAGWCPDVALVEILEANFIGQAESEMVAQWVKCLDVKLEIPIGTPVLIWGSRDAGVVAKHYPELAKYGVRIPGQKKTDCWVLLPEEVEVLA